MTETPQIPTPTPDGEEPFIVCPDCDGAGDVPEYREGRAVFYECGLCGGHGAVTESRLEEAGEDPPPIGALHD